MTLKFDEATHRYYVDGRQLPSVTTCLHPLYRGPEAGAAVLRRAANVGTVVHALTEDDDRRWPAEVPDAPDLDYGPAKKHVGRRLAWLDWRRRAGFTPVHIEKRLASPDGYAGTVDRVGLLAGVPAVIDIKSGRVPAYARLQLSAYARMVRQARLMAGVKEFARVIVQVSESGRWRAHAYPDHAEDEKDWRAAHRLFVRLFSVSWAADAPPA